MVCALRRGSAPKLLLRLSRALSCLWWELAGFSKTQRRSHGDSCRRLCLFCPGETQLQSGRRQVSGLAGSSCKQPGTPARGTRSMGIHPSIHPCVPVRSTEPPGSSAGPLARPALSRVLTGEGTAGLLCCSWDRAVSLGSAFHPVAQVACIPSSAHCQ